MCKVKILDNYLYYLFCINVQIYLIFLNFFGPIKYQNHFLIFQCDRSSVLNSYDKNLIFDFLKEKLSSFAVVLSSVNTNPVNYS